MDYLLDTQIVIWYQIGSKQLSLDVHQLIEQANTVYVSMASLFEIAIKQALGKLPGLAISIAELSDLIKRDGFTLLELKTAHLQAYGDIPLLPEHRDPFDRLLLATALSENIPIISADESFALYQPQIQWVVAK